MKKKRIISFITLTALLLITPIHAAAATRFSDGVYTFEKTEAGTAVIVECNLSESEIEIPGQVLGYPVTGIGDYAFMEYSGVASVTLPDSVTSVGEYSFAENPDLQLVTFPSSCVTIADNAFWNSPNVTIRCYYDSAAYHYAEENGIAAELLDSVLLGDSNADNYVSISDVTKIQQHIAELERISGIYLKASDVNADGAVDIADATAVQRFIAEFDVPYPIGEIMK